MALNELHENALRDLNPLDLCEQIRGDLVVPSGTPCPCQFCSIRRVDAAYFDAAATSIAQIHVSAFSLEEADSLDLWEELLGLLSDSSLTEVQRWARVRDARTTRNGLSKPFFIALATRLGYSIEIERGVYPFRAGISRIGIDAVKRVNRLTVPVMGDVDDIRNKTEFISNPMDRSGGTTPITLTQPYPSDFWTWVVRILSLGTNTDSQLLRSRFEALKPDYSVIIWEE